MSRFHVFSGAPTTRDIQRARDSNSKNSHYVWNRDEVFLDGDHVQLLAPQEPKLLSTAEVEVAHAQISRLLEVSLLDASQPLSTHLVPPLHQLELSESWDEIETRDRTAEETRAASPSAVYSEVSTPFLLKSNLTSTTSADTDPPGDISRPPQKPKPLPNRLFNILREDSLSKLSDSNLTESFTDETSSSFALFPRFRFVLTEMQNLSNLASIAGGAVRRKRTLKVSFLAAVLEVDGPVGVTLKQGPESGTSVSLLKLIVGEDTGVALPLTVWREAVDAMAGYEEPEKAGIRKGDIVAFHDILFCDEPPEPPTLVASPKLKSRHETCYRTLPTVSTDRRLTPDLRLGFTDPAVRRVSEIANWLSRGSTSV